MAVVYRAWNLRLKRLEAVKVIAHELVRDKSFRERFERETEIAANIDHPHVVTLYDSGEGPDGQLFLAMRYVDGTTLDRLINDRGALEPALAATLISQVASALDAAHVQGLVHRDVKPANILISGGEGHYHAYLADFGLAKRVSSETLLTTAGLMVGTIDYMAPEQAQGRAVDLRADVYALGATLFKALTGQVPYPREQEVARLFAKLREPLPIVSQVAANVPPAFDPVIARAMSQDPAERYPAAGDLGRAALAAASPRTQSAVRTIGPGVMLGDLLLEAVAGEGGMGVVYRAKQVKLDRTVAVKVMSREVVEDPAFRAQFERECQIAASIDHPNVIPIYSAGDANGVLYVVMRFISGGSLKEALFADGRLETERAVEVIEQVASALDVAHGRGLVHRDIKPSNVLIDEQTGRVLLTDFGLAKAVSDSEITVGGVLGTARYMAPERSEGSVLDDVRGDIYSLGCVLWDLLGGTERIDLSTVADVPPALADVVTRSVALEPTARYGTAGELAQAARSALSGQVEGAPSQSEVDQLRAGRSVAPVVDERRQPFAPEPLSSGLSERVVSLCDDVLKIVGEEDVRQELLAVRQELLAPLRLATVGGSGDDRPRLLSALLGRRFAGPSDGAFDWTVSFAHGAPERVEAELEDGGRLEHALTPDGLLPEEAMRATVRTGTPLRVWLPIDALRTVTLVSPADEPASGNQQPLTELAEAFLVLVSTSDARDADAMHAAIVGDMLAVQPSAVNCACVLLAEDPSMAADDATEAKRALGPLVAGIVSLSPLLALPANAGLISEGMVSALVEIAALESRSADEVLASEYSLLEATGAPSRQQRHELLALIGLRGVRAAVELADTSELTVAGLTRRLRELSGIDDAVREIDGLQQRADALKAARGLAALEQLSYRRPTLSFLRDQVESMRFEPAMHVVELVRALERCVAEQIELPAELLARLERLVTARAPGGRLGIEDKADDRELHRAALAQFQTWKAFENGSQASPVAARVAQIVTRSLQLIAREAEQASGADPRPVHG